MVHVMSEVKKYNAYAEGLTVHFELDSEGAWVAASDFDAQRLRADTAEADALSQYAKRVAAVEELAVAEQRIAELLVMLRQAWVDDCVSAADCRNIDAALNPNPESHYSDCATNNRGVPELLGPCDCGYEGDPK
jgi:hypothetical protein